MFMYKIAFGLLGSFFLWLFLLPVLPDSKLVLYAGCFFFFGALGAYFLWELFLIVEGFKAMVALG